MFHRYFYIISMTCAISISSTMGLLGEKCRVCGEGCGSEWDSCREHPQCNSTISLNNPRCRLEISVTEGHYINLTINNFNVTTSESGGISRTCIDHMSVSDSRFDRLIGNFCNKQQPPSFLLSPWNKLRIVFNTNSEYKFNFTVKSSKFTLPFQLEREMDAPPKACPPGWNFYRGHCYRAYKERESLQWHDAEEKCSFISKGRDGHLVSILDQKEMKVVHHFLTREWHSRPNNSFYIGLIDRDKEGAYRWSDHNPMSYTDWAKGGLFGDKTAPQPDGGAYEDCTIIKYDSYHSTDNWHDIPCSLGKNRFSNLSSKDFEDYIDSYICKMDASVPSLNVTRSREELYDDVNKPSSREVIQRIAVKEKYFVCDNNEVISFLQRCDGTPTCRDGSDENNCFRAMSQSCLPDQFRCADGGCISIAFTCDFVKNCHDGSDEKHCTPRKCKSSEFKCNSGQCIPYTQRCDLRNDCRDKSDEGQECASKGSCNQNITFQCYFGNCIPLTAVCDRHQDCPGKFHEDEQESFCSRIATRSITSTVRSTIVCQSGQIIDASNRCIYDFDQYGYQIGCRDVSHLRNCEDFKCSRDYVKCPNSYCIPPRYICDGKRDCVGGEDEARCEKFTCPGQYKCMNHTSCILLQQLCDSVRHCHFGDDEWFCDLTCPIGCECIGLYANCARGKFDSLPQNLTKGIRKLDLSHNQLGPTMARVDFRPHFYLIELILQNNGIEILKASKFSGLKNLQLLDLRYNRLTVIESAAFSGLIKVNTLRLEGNPNISVIHPNAFSGLTELPSLNISHTKVRELKAKSFYGLERLQRLVFAHNSLESIETGCFIGLNSTTSLDLTGNEIKFFKKDMFAGLDSLRMINTSSFKFCCIVASPPFNIPFDRCLPSPDEISDCEDLMSSPVQRAFLWILGGIALCCNVFVIIWRSRLRSSPNKVSCLLILSLGCADCLMGIYMLTIASVDVYYRGRYIEVSDVWRNSVLCKICGFLSTLSTEASVFTLVFITIDRLICICFPFSKYRLTLQFTYKLVICSWLIALLISVLPLIAIPYFKDQFYSRSGVCLALHITNKNPAGWEYSVAIFLFLNLIAFIIIVTCYLYMYKVVLDSQRRMSRVKTTQLRERLIGRQMALIVGSNFLCWFPIIIMGLLAINGYRLPATVYSWTAVFVLPLNSATNPILYTLAELRPKLFRSNRRDSLTNRFLVSKNSNSTHQQKVSKSMKPPPGYVRLSDFLRDGGVLNARHLLEITCSLCEQLKEIHEKSFALGGMEADNVFVSERIDPKRLQVYLPDHNAFKVLNATESDDYALDMEEFGLMVKRMLTQYSFKRNLSFNIENSK